MAERVVVYDQEFASDSPPLALAEYIAWLGQKMELVPEAYRSSAMIEHDVTYCYEGGPDTVRTTSITISYYVDAQTPNP